MYATLFQTALFVLAVFHRVAAADLEIDTPALTQCQNATISYSGGQGSYGIYIVPSSDSCADSVVDIPIQNGTSYNWLVNIPAGSEVECLVEDSTGAEAWSGIVTVQNSSDASCVSPEAAQALNAAGSASSALTGSTAVSQPTASTTLDLPSVSGITYPTAAQVSPAVGPGVANAASGNVTATSGSVTHVGISNQYYTQLDAFRIQSPTWFGL
ncbi:hypothetical protein K439DRAFT_760464 [Ramaria rubella]|nr:hypothetical protein K439DRAFT_763697 [Ramaria rubella]KAF8575239.1 hypothetical protein K439DRAFT_760464 [Ramaria rubella]